MDLVVNVLHILAVIAAIASVVTYSTVDWWGTRVGRHLMTYMVGVAGILTLLLLDELLGIGGNPVYEFVFLVFSIVLAIALYWRLILIIQARRRAKRDAAHRRK